MKRGPDFHASFIARIWEQLGSGQGVIAASWIANELARLDSVQGDIDTISTRIAAARTWAFIANQPDWLEDPVHWIERCSALEEKLSDALHARLTERFVDRRAKMLRRVKESLSGPTTVQIDGDGTVRVEGEALGTLTGFSFRPDPAARHEDRKALLIAAERVLDREMLERAKALVSAKDQEISLRLEPGEPIALIWRGVVAAQLTKGRGRLDPLLNPDTAISRLSEPWRSQIIERLNRWVRARIDHRLGRLRWVSRAAISPEQPPVLRAVLAALTEGLGTADRASLAETLAELSPDHRGWLRQAGIIIGPLDIFIEALLKPGAAELRVALSCVAENLPMLSVPMPGLGLIDRPTEALAKSAQIAGYRRFGDQMIRIDHVNRIALALHKQRKGNEAFAPDVSVANRLGIGPPTLARILRAIGFEPFGKPADDQWRWKGLRRPRDRRPTLNPAFAALKGLSRI
jgi:ATP-dependent RNA helicase SUPV3L1/SUV3